MIYLDSKNDENLFDENHLQLLIAIAGVSTIALDNIRQFEWFGSETRRLQAETEVGRELVGESQSMLAVNQVMRKVAPTNSTVLILGESGTGKELAARAIHKLSNRKEKPFIAINCAGLSENLLESELFGHEKGAFTGAVSQIITQRPGKRKSRLSSKPWSKPAAIILRPQNFLGFIQITYTG